MTTTPHPISVMATIYQLNSTMTHFNASNGTTVTPATSGSQDNSSSYTVPINICLGTLMVFINAFVICLFVGRPSLQSAPSNRILLSLAARDLVSGVLVFVHIVVSLTEVLRRAATTQALVFRIFLDVISTGNRLNAIFHLCLIAADRFVSIFYALRYADLVTGARVKVILPVTWFIAYAISFLQVTWLHRIMTDETSDADWIAIGEVEPWYSAVVMFIFVLLPLVLVGIGYVAMFLEIKRIVNYNSQESNRKARQKQQSRVLHIFLTIYICFTLLSLPHFLSRLVMDIYSIEKRQHGIKAIYLNIIYIVGNMASITTPLLYTLYKQDFRQALKATVDNATRLICDKVGLQRPRTGSRDDFFRFSHTTEMSMTRDRSHSSSTVLAPGHSPDNRPLRLATLNKNA